MITQTILHFASELDISEAAVVNSLPQGGVIHTDPSGTCSSQSGCGTLTLVNSVPRSCRAPQDGQTPNRVHRGLWGPPPVSSQIRGGLTAEKQSPLLWCLWPSAGFPQRSHFPAVWGNFSVLGTQAETHRSNPTQGTLAQEVKKKNMSSWASKVSSLPSPQPAQHRVPGAQQAARAIPLCSSSPLMDVWGYLAQKLHLLHREHNAKVWCCMAIFLKASTRDFSCNRDKGKKGDPELQPSCGTEQSHCFEKWGFVSPLMRV